MTDSNQPYQSPQDNDELSFCCQNCSTSKRKLGFYVTLFAGVILYIVSIVNFFGSVFGGDISFMYPIFACLITLLCPLWMKSFSQVLSGLREPSRKLSFLVLLVSLIGLIIFGNMGTKFFALLFTFTLILSGLWLSLSYYQNGQESLLQYIKRCLFRSKGNNNNFGNNGNSNV